MPVLAFLPVLSFILLLLSFRLRTAIGWREAFLTASLLLGFLAVLATEALSLFHLVTFGAIVTFWTAVSIGSAVFLYFSAHHRNPDLPGERLTPFSRVLLGCIAAYVVMIVVIATLAPPNTGDTFEYHMPKVVQWVQNHTIAFFPTAVPRQNHLAPGAEYAILHLQILSGSDRFANLVEWMSMLGSLVATSLVARQLGARAKGQLLSAVFAVTLPMGIMQASSTQTDYVVSFWLICFVYYILRFRFAEEFSLWVLVGMSASLGLAVFSKATAYIIAPAFLVLLVVSRTKISRRGLLKWLPVMMLVFISINGGHYTRNWELYTNPLGPRQEPAPNTRYSMETHSPKAVLSNFSKNIATHLGTPWPRINTAIANFYMDAHKKIGFDVNDPRTSWGTGSVNRFGVRKLNYLDEVDGNPVHFMLAVLSGLLLLFSSTLRKDRLLLSYASALAAGALLFIFYLKWHPWMSRLHMPFFVLAAPLVGIVLTRLWNEKVVNATAVVLLLVGTPWLLFCQQRPIIGQENIFNTPRERLYLMTRRLRNVEQSFLSGKAMLQSRNASRIGLIVSNSSIEYWWWVALQKDSPNVRFQQVNVQEPSTTISLKKPFCEFQPDALLALDQKPLSPLITVGQAVYSKQWEEGRAAIYFRTAEAQAQNQ
jgi:hypothetical protein